MSEYRNVSEKVHILCVSDNVNIPFEIWIPYCHKILLKVCFGGNWEFMTEIILQIGKTSTMDILWGYAHSVYQAGGQNIFLSTEKLNLTLSSNVFSRYCPEKVDVSHSNQNTLASGTLGVITLGLCGEKFLHWINKPSSSLGNSFNLNINPFLSQC